MARYRGRGAAAAGILVAALAGCGGSSAATIPSAGPAPKELRAVTTLAARSGSAMTGTATFTQVGTEPVRVRVQVEHATPGLHGVHMHEKGNCSDPDAKGAGGHFNPHAAPHAGLETEVRHAGDLGNIEVRENGAGDVVATTDLLTVAAGDSSVIGLAVVVHASPDDLATQPAGNSGVRQACGVVSAASS